MRLAVALGRRLDGHQREVLSGAVVALVLRGAGAGLAFLFNVAIGRLLGAEGAGLYFLALSVAMIGSVVARLGLENTLLRFVAAEAAAGNWGAVRGVMAHGMKLAAAAGVIAALAALALAGPIARHLFGDAALTPHLRVMGLAILPFSLMTLYGEALKGLKKIAFSMLTSGIFYPVFGLAVIWPSVALWGSLGASLAFLFGTVLATLAGWLLWTRTIAPYRAAAADFPFRTLIDSSRPLWVMTLLNRAVVPWAPLFLLGIWGSPAETGIFGAATRVAMLVSFFLIAVNTAIAPKFAELHRKGDMAALSRVARTFAAIVTLGASPLLLTLILAGDWVMGLFGPDFRAGGTALAILALGQAVNVATGSVSYLLTMSGHNRDARNASVLGVVALVLVALVLTPALGLIGAAWAATAGVVTGNVAASVLVLRRLHILPLPIVGAFT